MSKRFTETDKWEDTWFRGLDPLEKLLFNYLCDKCNLAGFIELDIDLISFHTKMTKEQVLGAKQGLNKGLIEVDNWVWIINFLKHQKNLPLNPLNNAHKHIIFCINQQSDRFSMPDIVSKLGADMGLFSPIGKGISIGKVKKGGEGGKQFVPPTIEEFKDYFESEGFNPIIGARAWKGYNEANWHNTKGKPVRNWKTTCQNVWFTDENKVKIVEKKTVYYLHGTKKTKSEVDAILAYNPELKKDIVETVE